MFRTLVKPDDSKLAELSLKQRQQLFAYRQSSLDTMITMRQAIHEVATQPFNSRAVYSESPKREGRLRTISE